jgi:DNA-binding response OmpR family regulator
MDPRISLLVIDDDQELCTLMKAFFEQQNIEIQSVYDGKAGLEEALKGEYDLIILDIMMPEMDGFEVLRRIREFSRVPIIMLTARMDQKDRIDGLNAGADDYLPKPFAPPELLARIRAILRRSRMPTNAGDALEISGIRLDPNTRMVWQSGKEIDLTSIEYEILRILMQTAGKVVSRNYLTMSLYNREAAPYERAVDVHISNLRRKLESQGQEYILTVRGAGYLFKLKSFS